jgi:hypothetical protein
MVTKKRNVVWQRILDWFCAEGRVAGGLLRGGHSTHHSARRRCTSFARTLPPKTKAACSAGCSATCARVRRRKGEGGGRGVSNMFFVDATSFLGTIGRGRGGARVAFARASLETRSRITRPRGGSGGRGGACFSSPQPRRILRFSSESANRSHRETRRKKGGEKKGGKGVLAPAHLVHRQDHGFVPHRRALVGRAQRPQHRRHGSETSLRLRSVTARAPPFPASLTP